MTPVDDKIKKAKELISEARDLLYETAYQGEEIGWEEYTDEYQDTVRNSFLALVKVSDDLSF